MRAKRIFVVTLICTSGFFGVTLVRPACRKFSMDPSWEPVDDPSGAAVPDAQVTATSVQTGLRRHASTNSAGQYRILDLPQATYDLDVTAPGFKPLRRTGVIGHSDGAVWSLAFSPDGKTLASGGADRTVRLWNLDEDAWVSRWMCPCEPQSVTCRRAALFQPRCAYHRTCPGLPGGDSTGGGEVSPP